MRTRIGSYRQRFRIAAGILWASPWTAVGCLVGLLALCTGCKVRWRCGVIEFYGGAINWILARLPVGPIAMTLGHTILGRTDAGLDLARSHELVHVRQYERWGLLFVPAYLLSSLAAWIAGKHFYRDNGFEREAFERDGMVRRGWEAESQEWEAAMLDKRRKDASHEQQVGVPRRFSVGTLMVITAMYSVLFAVTRWLPPVAFVVVALFFTGIGTAQATLYGGRNPRHASLVAGACMSVILALAAVLGVPTDGASLLCAAPFLIVGAVLVAGVGAILGYLAGALTAGVFLFARWDQRANEAEEQAAASVPVGERAAAAEPPKP